MGFKNPSIAHIAEQHTKKLLGIKNNNNTDKTDHQIHLEREQKELQKYQDPNSQCNIRQLYEKDYMKTHKISFSDINNKFGFKTASDKKTEEKINRMQAT
jgi:hypothetical protein